MQNVETIYEQAILPLPKDEKLQIAAMILQNLASGEKAVESAYDVLQSIRNERVFSSTKEVDDHLRTERDSWDN